MHGAWCGERVSRQGVRCFRLYAVCEWGASAYPSVYSNIAAPWSPSE